MSADRSPPRDTRSGIGKLLLGSGQPGGGPGAFVWGIWGVICLVGAIGGLIQGVWLAGLLLAPAVFALRRARTSVRERKRMPPAQTEFSKGGGEEGATPPMSYLSPRRAPRRSRLAITCTARTKAAK
jgi:hypothetical protein